MKSSPAQSKGKNTRSKNSQTRRTRRTTEEVIECIVEAAIEEFESRSYMGATTAAIARRAGVTEALIFNHFGSKAQLFRKTIFKMLDHHFNEFVSTHPTEPTDEKLWREGSREYIDALQDFIADHAGMFLSLVFAQSYKTGDVEGVAGIKGLQDYFDRMVDLAEGSLTGTPQVAPKYIARISFATILSSILFKDWLFPDDSAEEESIRNAISAFVLDGLNVNR